MERDREVSEQALMKERWAELATAVILRAREDLICPGPTSKSGKCYKRTSAEAIPCDQCRSEALDFFLGDGFEFWIKFLDVNPQTVLGQILKEALEAGVQLDKKGDEDQNVTGP